jgi:hypothetical protein
MKFAKYKTANIPRPGKQIYIRPESPKAICPQAYGARAAHPEGEVLGAEAEASVRTAPRGNADPRPETREDP